MYKHKDFSIKAQVKNVGTNAEILIYGEIADEQFWGDEVTAKQVNDEIESVGDVAQIDVRINSYGGSVFAGTAIASMLDRKKKRANGGTCKITTYVDGIAASMGSVIAMVGDEVVMPENAMMMIHKPSNFVWGNADDLRKAADLLDSVENNLVNFYMRHFIGTKEEIKSMLADETWLNGSDCFKKGLCTKIETPVQIAANAKGYTVNGLKLSKDLTANAKTIIDQNVNLKGGENEMFLNEELQYKIKDFIENGKSCILAKVEDGSITAVEKTVESVEKPFISNEMVIEVFGCEIEAAELLQNHKSFVEIGQTPEQIQNAFTELENLKKINDDLKIKSEQFDKVRESAIENALKMGTGAMGARNTKLESKNTFDVERYKKIFQDFTLDEINAQAKEWENEKCLLLNAGGRTSLPYIPSNTEPNVKTVELSDYQF